MPAICRSGVYVAAMGTTTRVAASLVDGHSCQESRRPSCGARSRRWGGGREKARWGRVERSTRGRRDGADCAEEMHARAPPAPGSQPFWRGGKARGAPRALCVSSCAFFQFFFVDFVVVVVVVVVVCLFVCLFVKLLNKTLFCFSRFATENAQRVRRGREPPWRPVPPANQHLAQSLSSRTSRSRRFARRLTCLTRMALVRARATRRQRSQAQSSARARARARSLRARAA